MEKATIYDLARVCASFEKCSQCFLFNFCAKQRNMFSNDIDKANEIILKWCEEHPTKTRQSEIQKTIPNLILTDVGYCNECPARIDGDFYTKRVCDNYNDCDKCKKEYWLAEVEE